MDGSRVIVACALTEPTADDAMTGISLVDEVDGHLTRVTADPAYDTLAFYGAAGARGALLHESSLARTMPTDRILTCRCDTTLVGRGRSSD